MAMATDMVAGSPKMTAIRASSYAPAKSMRALRALSWAVATTVIAGLSLVNTLGNVHILENVRFPVSLGVTLVRPKIDLADKHLARLDKGHWSEMHANEAIAMVQSALAEEPLSVAAARTLGFIFDQAGRKRAAMHQLMFAETLTRRDLGVQLWMIEHYVAGGDIERALQHYDIALRTNLGSGVLLFPPLANALEAPEIRAEFAPYVRNPSSWMSDFIIYAAERGENPAVVARALREAGGLPRLPAYHEAQIRMLKALFLRQFYAEGLRLYRTLPGSTADQANRVDFSRETTVAEFAPATWATGDGNDFVTEIETDNDSRKLKYRVLARSGVRGVALSKVLALGSGTYSLSYAIKANGGDVEQADAYWQLRCGAEVGLSPPRRVSKMQVAGGGVFQDSLLVPNGCMVQSLELVLSGGLSSEGIEYVVHSMKLS